MGDTRYLRWKANRTTEAESVGPGAGLPAAQSAYPDGNGIEVYVDVSDAWRRDLQHRQRCVREFRPRHHGAPELRRTAGDCFCD
jgi:hypothetical protein